MADGTRDDKDRDKSPADEAHLSARLRRLGDRLGQVGTRRSTEAAPGSSPPADTSAMARGFRLSTELVAGVIVGAMLGWLIDRWLGTTPWGMMVLLLLGFAAGVLNVMRAAGIAPGGVLPSDRVERRDD